MDVRTKDGYLIRLKPMSITEQRIQAAQETAIRNIMDTQLVSSANDMTLSELVKAIISGDMARDLANACKVIIPIKRVEIRRTEVLEVGTPRENHPSRNGSGQEAAAAEAAARAANPILEEESSEEEAIEEEEEETSRKSPLKKRP